MPRKRSDGNTLNLNEVMVLIAIRKKKKAYGYDIINLVDEASKSHVHLTVGRLYPMLHRLEKSGYLRSSWGDDEPEEVTGGARRKYYQLTASGKKILAEFVVIFPIKYEAIMKEANHPAVNEAIMKEAKNPVVN